MNRRLFAVSVAARLPQGMLSIAVLIHVAHVTGSFATAGLCTAVLAVSEAVGGPVAGRMVDRRGQFQVLLATAAGCTVGLTAMALSGAGAGTGWLVGCSALIGASAPPVGACVRALIPDLVPSASAQRRVYAADAAATEITWVVGPVLTFALAGWNGTATALLGAATILVVSVAGFAGCAASRSWRPVPRESVGRAAMSSVNLRVLVAALIGVGVLFGATEVAVTALAESLGAPGAAGLLLGLWGLGSLCGGVVAARFAGGGARTGRGLARLLVLLGAGHLLLAGAADHWILLAVAIAGAGSMIAPVLATAYAMVDEVAPIGTHTEAFAWLATATAVGTAAGAAAAGVVIEAQGPVSGLLLAGVAAFLAAALTSRRLRVGASPQPAPASVVAEASLIEAR